MAVDKGMHGKLLGAARRAMATDPRYEKLLDPALLATE
jgi:hypothetical protein